MTNENWHVAFESAMGGVLTSSFGTGCVLCVEDCSADTVELRIAKAMSATMRFAALGVRGMVWQIEEGDARWRRSSAGFLEVLSVASSVGMDVVVVSDDICGIHGCCGFDAVGIDWCDWGRRTGALLAESGVECIRVGLDGVDDGIVAQFQAGIEIEFAGRKVSVRCGNAEALILEASHGLHNTAVSAYVFLSTLGAERFFHAVEERGIEISADTLFFEFGKAGTPISDATRVMTICMNCVDTAKVSLSCIFSRLAHPSCPRMIIRQDPELHRNENG